MSCPCGSGTPEPACCARYHRGELAPTALALMRSRYAAYVRGEIDYLVATHDDSTRDQLDVPAMTAWARDTEWQGLEIVATEAGGESDTTGIVEFIASRHHRQARICPAGALAVPQDRRRVVLHRRQGHRRARAHTGCGRAQRAVSVR